MKIKHHKAVNKVKQVNKIVKAPTSGLFSWKDNSQINVKEVNKLKIPLLARIVILLYLRLFADLCNCKTPLSFNDSGVVLLILLILQLPRQ